MTVAADAAPTAAPWQEVELTLTAGSRHRDPYGAVDVWADFTHESGAVLRRPAFYDGPGDGGHTWRVRFASPLPSGTWRWRSGASVADAGLADREGSLEVRAPAVAPPGRFERHGFWRMAPDGLTLQHADGTPALLVGDTAWGLPWRATPEQVRTYAADRSAKGFNAVLLMSVQPDTGAEGPEDRTADEGFGRGFRDLPEGTLTDLDVGYFQHLDVLVDVLVEHGVVPVWQPVFQGFGWKGLGAAGTVVPTEQYARYCRYLVARYGARPALWLVGADGSGHEPQIAAGGAEVHAWDCYEQPTGVHYRPHATNDAHQDADWLDFQWCQTGHSGEHFPERVADMARNTPLKGVANGEPSYENTGRTGRAAGWWQGHEAWANLCAGGTMGVVYGAGSLWQWKLHPDEPGHSDFFSAPGAGWREALDFEGSTYVGLVGRILDGLPLTGARPDWTRTLHPRGLLVPGVLFLTYLAEGGDLRVLDGADVPRAYRVLDPRTGEVVAEGVREHDDSPVPDPGGAPRVYVCTRPAA
ncbi:apiosidase-like domain-containing protein [Kineococcus terrestris]|uniref:apiosidase-like domain-containing protein n=1 Tax=Kineococcus terrestris TaxID=2044856 RepID=UPI0034DB0674